MPSFKIFDVAGSGMSAQSVRLNTVASNLANADSISGDPSTVYKARHPIFEAVKSSLAQGTESGNAAVHVKGIMESQAPAAARYEPGNPLANADGYVYSPNVNAVEEMVDMISSMRAYEINSKAIKNAEEMMTVANNMIR